MEQIVQAVRTLVGLGMLGLARRRGQPE